MSEKVAALAETYQVAIAPCNTKGPVGITASAHVRAAIPNRPIQEMLAPSVIPSRNDVLTYSLVIGDGYLLLPDRPGLGVELNQKALKPHLQPKLVAFKTHCGSLGEAKHQARILAETLRFFSRSPMFLHHFQEEHKGLTGKLLLVGHPTSIRKSQRA